jgi:hypothetical protein
MLKITSIALGLLSVISMTSGAQAMPNETYRPNQQPAIIRAEDLANHRGTEHNRPVVIQNRRVEPLRAEGRRHRRVYAQRNNHSYNVYQHRNEHRKYHSNNHGVMRRHH